MDFHTAVTHLVTDLTPRPWNYTDAPGTVLTVAPAGLPEDPGCAEVLIFVSAPEQPGTEAGVPSRDIPAMIDALTSNRMWSYDTLDDVSVTLLPFGGGGMTLAVSPDPDAAEDPPQVHIPEAEHPPFAAALRRALNAARGWES